MVYSIKEYDFLLQMHTDNGVHHQGWVKVVNSCMLKCTNDGVHQPI